MLYRTSAISEKALLLRIASIHINEIGIGRDSKQISGLFRLGYVMKASALGVLQLQACVGRG
jgi:hypothetical protein